MKSFLSSKGAEQQTCKSFVGPKVYFPLTFHISPVLGSRRHSPLIFQIYPLSSDYCA